MFFEINDKRIPGDTPTNSFSVAHVSRDWRILINVFKKEGVRQGEVYLYVIILVEGNDKFHK